MNSVRTAVRLVLGLLVTACGSAPDDQTTQPGASSGGPSSAGSSGAGGIGSRAAGSGDAAGSASTGSISASATTGSPSSSPPGAIDGGGSPDSPAAAHVEASVASGADASTGPADVSVPAANADGATRGTFPPGCTCMNLGPPTCAPTGQVSYTLARAPSPTAAQTAAYAAITCAMDGAIAYYNCHTTITKALHVSFDTGVPTADGNFNGTIRFGGSPYMECVTAMHEIAHAVGIGTAPSWGSVSVNGVFSGPKAMAQLRAITGNPTDVLHSDTQHFWPYGLNFTSEAKSTADLLDHCLMVTAIRSDLRLQ